MSQKMKDTLNGFAIFVGVPIVMFTVLFILPCYVAANGIPFLK